jgi:hypothetical protein
MKLLEQSQSTRTQSRSVEERTAKRRTKWPLVDGFGPVPVDDLGGTAQVVTSATRGGLFLEFAQEDGTFHAVPVEAIAALGFKEPDKAPGAKPSPK